MLTGATFEPVAGQDSIAPPVNNPPPIDVESFDLTGSDLVLVPQSVVDMREQFETTIGPINLALSDITKRLNSVEVVAREWPEERKRLCDRINEIEVQQFDDNYNANMRMQRMQDEINSVKGALNTLVRGLSDLQQKHAQRPLTQLQTTATVAALKALVSEAATNPEDLAKSSIYFRHSDDIAPELPAAKRPKKS